MSQYLGDISAYALAVSQGYTGTEEEYAELMASYATVGQTAVTAAQTATTKASEAATSATTATNKASEATTAATTATTKAAEAQADADAAALDASQALSAASTATTKATEATTAAATATSAATTATTAKDDAVSAKTAAQTAQTGAETAAASVSASAAQIATNAEDITQLKSEFTDLETGIGATHVKSVNLFDKSTITNGKTFDSYGDVIDGGTTDNISDYVDVDGFEKIVVGYYNANAWITLNTYIVAYDANKTKLTYRDATGTAYTLPSNTKYVRFRLGTAYINFAMVVSYDYTPNQYISYYNYYDYLAGAKQLIADTVPREIHVGAGKEYASFSEAVIEGLKTPNSTIYVADGTYDIESEFKAIYGNDFFTNFTSTGRRGLFLGNGIKIIMSPKATIKFVYTGDNANVKEKFSPFNFAPYNTYASADYPINGFTLIGGRIIVKNGRYCVHDDPSSFNKPYRNVYKNVYMELDNTENLVWGSKSCIGAGLGTNGMLEVDGCILNSIGNDNNTGSLSVHNTEQPNAQSYVVIKNNYIYGLGTIRLLYFGTSTLMTNAMVTNNNIGRAVELQANTQDYDVENIKLIAWNNYIH